MTESFGFDVVGDAQCRCDECLAAGRVGPPPRPLPRSPSSYEVLLACGEAIGPMPEPPPGSLLAKLYKP